jgi:hypothetical protein
MAGKVGRRAGVTGALIDSVQLVPATWLPVHDS